MSHRHESHGYEDGNIERRLWVAASVIYTEMKKDDLLCEMWCLPRIQFSTAVSQWCVGRFIERRCS